MFSASLLCGREQIYNFFLFKKLSLKAEAVQIQSPGYSVLHVGSQ